MPKRQLSEMEALSRIAISGTPYFAGPGSHTNLNHYGFIVNEDAILTSVTVIDSAGQTVAVNYTNQTLSAGIPFGAGSNKQGNYRITAVTVSSGSIILYES